MFGWEFPPHILGGLGTASYGLTRGMWECGDMEIDFVIPKPWGDEDRSFARIIGASQVPVAWRDVSRDYVEQRIGRYMSPEMYFGLRDHIYADFNYMRLNDLGCIEFSGRYPDNLLEEINNYSIAAGVIARTVPCDIIHSHDWLTYYAGQAGHGQAARDTRARHRLRPLPRQRQSHSVRHRARRNATRRPHHHRQRAYPPHRH